LLRTSEEKEKVALHLEESLARLEIAQIEREGFLDTLLESVEEERVRIAGELHDRPIQQLTMVNYDLALAKLYVEEGDTAAGLQELEVVEKNLSEQIDGLRKLMADLRPPALDQVGLIGALQDHVADFEQRCNIACSLDARLDVRPEPNVETVLYRVAQEALANVLKHAQADHVRLSLGQIDGEIVLKIQDDGVGFSSDRMSRGRDHFGMTSMEHRVELAGGSFLLTTGPDAGTTVEVHFGALVPQDLRTAA
jgi:signal transduction histidine kinase